MGIGGYIKAENRLSWQIVAVMLFLLRFLAAYF